MKAFILAAGKGTRMRPLTERTPKPLLPVAGKPIIQHLIDDLESKVDEIIILIGWEGEKIKEDVSSKEAELRFVKQGKLLGTADAVSYAEDFVENKFVCLNGDVIISKSALHDFIDFFSDDDECVVGTAEVDDPENYGIIRTDNQKVVELVEKPEHPDTNTVNSGLYGFTSEIFEAIDETERSRRGEFEITDSLQGLIDDSRLSAFNIERWYELSRPWDLLSVNEHMMEDALERNLKGDIEENVHIEGAVHVSKSATVKEGAYIQGPVYIGDNTQIGPNCLIRPSTHIGRGCKVGNAVEVKNSIIMDGTQVPHHNYVGDSVIGKNCNFGSGTKVANLRLDDENIVVVHREKKIDTGRRKLGVIMGDEVKTGINSMINPGTIVWSGCFIGPGALAQSEIGPNSKIK